ncbi:MAG: histidinol-phosphate transaminase [Myxococcota bacterium]|nr:histidinol-phosphate transaminase [Myxococcota bacterium]
MLRSYLRPEIPRLVGYVPGEQPRDRRYVKLNTNENPYPPSPRVLDAIRGAVTADLRLYPDPEATELRAKAGEVYGFPPESILAGNGSDELLAIILRACAGPGDHVVYPTPTYSLYDTLVAVQGATRRAVPFPRDFRLPVEQLDEQGQSVTIICNPNAPSGTLTPVAAIDELARRLRGLVLVDEAYVDFASETALPLALRHDNVVVLRTFSKSFSLCGMRIGLAFGQPGFIAELSKVRDSYNVSRLGLVAAVAALDDYAFMEGNAARVRSTRTVLADGLRKASFDVLPSETNFVLARRPGADLGPLQRMLKQRGVLVRHFDTPDLRDAMRVTVGTPDEIETLLAALSGT